MRLLGLMTVRRIYKQLQLEYRQISIMENLFDVQWRQLVILLMTSSIRSVHSSMTHLIRCRQVTEWLIHTENLWYPHKINCLIWVPHAYWEKLIVNQWETSMTPHWLWEDFGSELLVSHVISWWLRGQDFSCFFHTIYNDFRRNLRELYGFIFIKIPYFIYYRSEKI